MNKEELDREYNNLATAAIRVALETLGAGGQVRLKNETDANIVKSACPQWVQQFIVTEPQPEGACIIYIDQAAYSAYDGPRD